MPLSLPTADSRETGGSASALGAGERLMGLALRRSDDEMERAR